MQAEPPVTNGQPTAFTQALGLRRAWRFRWPEQALEYEFEADLSGCERTVSAECVVAGQARQLRGRIQEEQAGLRLSYTLEGGGGPGLEVAMLAVGTDSFVGQWRSGKNRAPQCAVLTAERAGGQWNLYAAGQPVIYKGAPARVLNVQYHSSPHYFYEVEKPDGGVADVAEDKLLPSPGDLFAD